MFNHVTNLNDEIACLLKKKLTEQDLPGSLNAHFVAYYLLRNDNK